MTSTRYRRAPLRSIVAVLGLAAAGTAPLLLPSASPEGLPLAMEERPSRAPLDSESETAPLAPTREPREEGRGPGVLAGPSSRGSRPEPAAGVPGESGSEDLDTPDPALRARAIDLLPRDPASVLAFERAIERDPDAYVRERAVLAYGEALGREAVPLLRRLALGDPSDEVRGAALASLDRIDSIDPRPLRGRLEVDGPSGPFDPRAPFSVTVRFSCPVAVRRATLAVLVPEVAEAVEPEIPLWKGPLPAEDEREVRFTLRFPGALPESAEISVRLKLDFEDRLDVELLGRDLALVFRAGDARVSPGATPRGRSPQRRRTIVLDEE